MLQPWPATRAESLLPGTWRGLYHGDIVIAVAGHLRLSRRTPISLRTNSSGRLLGEPRPDTTRLAGCEKSRFSRAELKKMHVHLNISRLLLT